MSLILRAFLLSSAVMLALLGLAAPTIAVGSGTFVIWSLSAVMLGSVFLGSAACLYVGWDPFEELFD
jgi:hypothetical protein